MLNNYEDLANAIVFTAIRDYQRALADLHCDPHNKRALKKMEDLSSFLTGDWCKTLTKIDGNILMSLAEKQLAEADYNMEVLKTEN